MESLHLWEHTVASVWSTQRYEDKYQHTFRLNSSVDIANNYGESLG